MSDEGRVDVRKAPLLDVAAHAAGLLCVSSALLLAVASHWIVKHLLILREAASYREGTFVVNRVVDRKANPRDSDDQDRYWLEGTVSGHDEEYEPETRGHHTGQQLAVMHNPAATFHDLRVVAREPGPPGSFADSQRRRVIKWISTFSPPLLVAAPLTLVLMLWRQRVTGLRPAWLYLEIAALLVAFGLGAPAALRLLMLQ